MCSYGYKKAWKKPDFPFNPHLTIYDGDSREFAEKLYAVISSYNIRLGFIADRLRPMITGKGSRNVFKKIDFDCHALRKIAGEVIEKEKIWLMPESHRLQVISRVCSYLADASGKTKPDFLKNANKAKKEALSYFQDFLHAFARM